MREQLLREIIEQIEEGLPDDTGFREFIENPDRLQDANDSADDPASLSYQWGRLLGAADWEAMTVEDLLRDHGLMPGRIPGTIVVWEPCTDGCPGWDHFNLGESTEGIQRCEDCGRFESDAEAKEEHDKHCNCGGGVAGNGRPRDWIQKCHACQNAIGHIPLLSAHRAYCGLACAIADGHGVPESRIPSDYHCRLSSARNAWQKITPEQRSWFGLWLALMGFNENRANDAELFALRVFLIWVESVDFEVSP